MQFLPKVLPHVYGAGKAVSFLFRNDRSVKDPNKETLEHFTTENIQRSVTYLPILSWKSFFYRLFLMRLVQSFITFDWAWIYINCTQLKKNTGTIYNCTKLWCNKTGHLLKCLVGREIANNIQWGTNKKGHDCLPTLNWGPWQDRASQALCSQHSVPKIR